MAKTLLKIHGLLACLWTLGHGDWNFCSHIQSLVELESVNVATAHFFEHTASLTYSLWQMSKDQTEDEQNTLLFRVDHTALLMYTVLHIFRQVLFEAGNQGNHQNFDLSLLSYKY